MTKNNIGTIFEEYPSSELRELVECENTLVEQMAPYRLRYTMGLTKSVTNKPVYREMSTRESDACYAAITAAAEEGSLEGPFFMIDGEYERCLGVDANGRKVLALGFVDYFTKI